MSEPLSPTRTDDAPLTTSKHGDKAQATADTLTQAKGDSVVRKTVTIARPRQELYDYWRALEKLPSFMDNVEAIKDLGGGRYHWTVKAPAGRTVEWTARITEDVPGELIAWTSEQGADVPNSGRIEFRDAPGGRGTWVSATILYDPPAGVVGKVIAKLFQREPAIQARRDLRRFKQLMETGEIATAAYTRKQLEEEKA